MSTPALFLWAIVFVVGIPSAWSNPTAGALVISKIAGWAIYQITGDNLPVEYYLFPDIFVLAVIFSKHEHACLHLYRSVWHQLKCVMFERSPCDRLIVLIFLAMWILYVADVHPYYKWWSLFWLVVAQFLAAGAESFLNCWRSHSMSGRETERRRDFPSDIDRFVEVNVPAQVQGHAAMCEAYPPTPVFAVPGNPSRSAGVPGVLLGVPHIRPLVAVAQIRDAIVGWVAVNMVDYFGRPISMVHGPSNSVSIGGITNHSCLQIPWASSGRERFLPGASGVEGVPCPVALEKVTSARSPKQFASLRLISEKLTKRFRGRYFSGSHCEEPFRDGQGRAVLQAPFRPAFSSITSPVLQRREADAVRKTPDLSGALLTVNGGGGGG